MKYLIIAALASIVFILVYTRIRPYLKLIQNVANSLNTPANAGSEKKLVRCESCGTWIPSERALSLRSGLATFCSTECMASKPEAKHRKLAG